MRRPLVPLCVLLAGLLLLTGCGITGTNKGGYITGDGRVTQWLPSHRAAPISLSGKTLEGKPLDIAADRGKVLVVNIWWSGCGPCRTEMPMLQAVSQEHAGEVGFVGIDIRDNSAQSALAWERSVGATYPSLYSPDGAANSAFRGLPGTTPVTVVLDKQGRMASLVAGPIPSKTTLDDLITCAGDDSAPHCGQKDG